MQQLLRFTICFVALVNFRTELAGSSSASSRFLNFQFTYTVDDLFPEFVKERIQTISKRLCGLGCLDRSYCKSYNYHIRYFHCEFLVTDSRLLRREHELGKLICNWNILQAPKT